MTVAALLVLAAILGLALWTDRRADFREARREARFPPEGRIIDVEGRATHVVVKGSGPDLVLIHGAGGSTRDFTFDLAGRLARRYRVFVVDRPGLGWSEEIDPRASRAFGTRADSPEAQARHLEAAVRALGAKTPILLGHSYGAAVALAWALGGGAAGVVAVSGAVMPWPGKIDIYYRLLGNPLAGLVIPPVMSAYATQSEIDLTLNQVFRPNEVPANYSRNGGVPLAIRARTLRSNGRQVAQLRPHVVDMAARYPGLAIPVEVVHGAADETCPPDVHAGPLANTLPNAALTLLDGVGHMAHHIRPDSIEDAVDRVAHRAGLR